MMAPILDHLISWLNTPQGNLVYSAGLAICVFFTLVATWYAGVNSSVPGKKSLQWGLLCLFFFQVLLFLASWLAWIGLINGHTYLPPLERAIALFSLALIVWLWVFPRPKRLETGSMIAVEVIIILLGLISVLWWSAVSGNLYYTSSSLGVFEYYLGIVLLVLGVILLIVKRPVAWGFGLVMSLIFLFGYLAQFLIPQAAGDYTWLVRLGEMAGFPFLLALPRRLLPGRVSISAESAKSISPGKAPQLSKQIIKTIIELCGEKTGPAYYSKLTRLVGQMMEADICLLVMTPKTGKQLIIPAGYNLDDDWEIEGFKVDGNRMPVLLNALESGKILRSSGKQPDSEMSELTRELAFKQAAQLLEVPYKQKDSTAKMGLLVLSKTSQPEWDESDKSRLIEIVNLLSSCPVQSETPAGQAGELAEVKQALQEAQAESDQLLQAYTKLKADFDRLVSQAPVVVQGEAGDAVTEETQKNQEETIRFLTERNKELENLASKGRPSADEVDQLRRELRSALGDLARIPTTLSKSDQKMLELQLSAMKRLNDMGQTELISTISQEFRQPLSSILGYTDLLLGESVGIIGAMQRKFLERVKASSERLGMLMNELVQVLAIDEGTFDQTPSNVEVEWVIERAVSSISAQVKEKNISVTLDITEELPSIQANRDALEQIMANLLQNACLVTPVDGVIKLSARTEQKDDSPPYLLISVTDQGGGIEQDDLPRVFSRRYRMENPLIQGIGDTGVGLSIVKSLVELLKGRVWVDTEESAGSTFTVLLPLMLEAKDKTIDQESVIPSAPD